MTEQTSQIKICVVGSGGVGKTCMILRLLRDTFDDEHIPTILDSFEKKFTIDGTSVDAGIIDTAGQDEMRSITDIAMNDASAFLIVYSITSALTFNEAQRFHDQIIRNDPNAKVVLVGNKCDMTSDRNVTTDQGKELAEKWKCPFFETSAKTRENIDNAFESVLRQLAGSAHKEGDDGCCLVY